MDDDDELLKELAEEDDDDTLASFRERRLDELRYQIAKHREMVQNQNGQYVTVHHEKEVLQITTTSEKCIVHFSHKDFRRCHLMDKHLEV